MYAKPQTQQMINSKILFYLACQLITRKVKK